jgi:hypothetical protein
MTTLAPPATANWAPHVDHELAQLIRLHHIMRRFWYGWLPDPVRRACRVAYASHFRALLTFFHDRRPSRARQMAVGCEEPSDITWGDFAAGQTPFPEWTDEEIRRVCDADKLVGHLSKDRVSRELQTAEWGSDQDHSLWRRYAIMFLGSGGPEHFPQAAAAWRKYEQGASDRAWRQASH